MPQWLTWEAVGAIMFRENMPTGWWKWSRHARACAVPLAAWPDAVLHLQGITWSRWWWWWHLWALHPQRVKRGNVFVPEPKNSSLPLLSFDLHLLGPRGITDDSQQRGQRSCLSIHDRLDECPAARSRDAPLLSFISRAIPQAVMLYTEACATACVSDTGTRQLCSRVQ